MEPTDLLAPPAALRTLEPPGAPYRGVLRASDPPTLWVAADEVPDAPWDASLDEHLLAPVDIARTGAGVALVLPVCPVRLVDLVHRRLSIADEEIVTIAVSLLRGCAAASARGGTRGVWWVTADGRPVLAVDDAEDAFGVAARVLGDLVGDRRDLLAEAVRSASEALGDERDLRRRQDGLEEALFAAAAPGPLVIDAAPVRARELSVLSRGPTAVDVGAHLDPGVAGRVRAAVDQAVAAVAAGWRPRRVRPREPAPAAPRTRRRAPVLLGALVAVVVVLVGALWPAPPYGDGGPRSSAAAPSATVSSAATGPSPPASEGLDAAAEYGPGAIEAGGEALAAYAQCPEDACRTALREGAGPPLPAGPATQALPGRSIEVIDDYGGVAVLRVSAPGVTAQFAVVVQAPGGTPTWLIRDVYDAADQP